MEKLFKRGQVFFWVCAMALTMIGCNTKKDYTLEYKVKYEPEKLFDLKKDDKRKYSLDVDTSVIGMYEVKWKDKEKEEVRKVKVKDSFAPEIELLQKGKKAMKVKLNTSYNPVGNINKISDKADGEMKNIKIVDQKVFDETLKVVKKQQKKAKKNVFKNNDEINTYKQKMIDHNYSVITSNVDVSKVGNYNVSVLSIDASYNWEKISYQVDVVDEEIDENQLAAGAENSKMGNAINYQITDSTKKEVEEKTEENKQNEAVVQNVSNGAMGKPSDKSQAPAVSDAVAVAAYQRVGQSFMCDGFVNAALKAAGRLESSAWVNPYALSKLATQISASQARQGDILYYDDAGLGIWHMAIYLGNGYAVHGGWNGEPNVQVGPVIVAGHSPIYYRFPSYVSLKDVNKIYFGDDYEDGSIDLGSGEIITTHYKQEISFPGVTVILESNSEFNDEAINAICAEYMESLWEGTMTVDQLKAKFESLGYKVTIK